MSAGIAGVPATERVHSDDDVCHAQRMDSRVATWFGELEDGPSFRFEDWPARHFGPGPSGVYTIWHAAEFLYAGMAWAHRDERSPKALGVFGRLASHASGRRSGDQFCVYVCDRFVVPDLTPDEIGALRSGVRLLDGRTRTFIREHLSYRVVLTPDGATARLLEDQVRRLGLPAAGRPLINPAN